MELKGYKLAYDSVKRVISVWLSPSHLTVPISLCLSLFRANKQLLIAVRSTSNWQLRHDQRNYNSGNWRAGSKEGKIRHLRQLFGPEVAWKFIYEINLLVLVTSVKKRASYHIASYLNQPDVLYRSNRQRDESRICHLNIDIIRLIIKSNKNRKRRSRF